MCKRDDVSFLKNPCFFWCYRRKCPKFKKLLLISSAWLTWLTWLTRCQPESDQLNRQSLPHHEFNYSHNHNDQIQNQYNPTPDDLGRVSRCLSELIVKMELEFQLPFVEISIWVKNILKCLICAFFCVLKMPEFYLSR